MLCVLFGSRERGLFGRTRIQKRGFPYFCGFVQSVITHFFQLYIMKNNLTFRYLLKKWHEVLSLSRKKKKHSAARFQNHTKGRNPLIIEKNL